MMSEYHLGCLEGTYSESSAVDSVCMSAPLVSEQIPDEVNLRHLLPVNDQGPWQSCCGNAADMLLQWYLALEHGAAPPNLSARFSYIAALEWAGNLRHGDNGVSIEAGIMAAHEIGTVLEEACPYWQPGERFDSILPPDLRVLAAQHRLQSVARVFSTEEVIQSLAQRRGATMFGMNWKTGHANYRGGVLTGDPGGQSMGGHAVCFVGYRRGGEILEFQNSHGRKWGDDGRMLVDYKYAQRLLNEPYGAFRGSGVPGFRKAAYDFRGLMA